MENKKNNDSKQSKQAGIVAAVASGSAISAFGVGYGGAAIYDKMSEGEIASEELMIEEDVEVEYDEELPEAQVIYSEPEPVLEEPVVGIDINSVVVNVGSDAIPDIDPDEVTDNILAEEMVDPADNDSLAVVEFTALNTRYDADGNEMTVAYFHNGRTDSDMMLVDNNGDGTFDYVADADGNYYADTVMGTVFTVDDVEAQISDSAYLAADSTSDTELDNGESYLNDIITV